MVNSPLFGLGYTIIPFRKFRLFTPTVVTVIINELKEDNLHKSLAVVMQVTESLSTSVWVTNVSVVSPVGNPLTYHAKDGLGPGLVMNAMNVSIIPGETISPGMAIIESIGAVAANTFIIIKDTAVSGDVQSALLVSFTVTTSPMAGTKV